MLIGTFLLKDISCCSAYLLTYHAANNGFTHPADRGEAGLIEEGVVGEVDE